MSSWKEHKLGELALSVSYGYTASAEEDPIGPKFLRITDIREGSINWDTVPYCSINEKDYIKNKVEIGDIVVARTGATTGITEIIKHPVDAVFASYLIRFRINQRIANPFFVGYVLKSKYWRDYVASVVGGSAQPGANAKQFAEFTFKIPNLLIQTAIVEILSSLDDKIELNNQINHELEALAQALFKHWFIDFEFPDKDGKPYKSSGGEMVESELGEIPKGWKIGLLDEVVTIKGGTTPSTKEPAFWGGHHHWTSPKDLSSLNFPVLLNTEKRITDLGLEKVGSGLLPKGTLLMSSRAPIGYLAITEIETAINQGYIAINSKKGFSNLFMLYWLKQNMDSVIEKANGSTFLEISKSNFKEIKIIIPNQEVLDLYIDKVNPMFTYLTESLKENEELRLMRDSLLPRLISGELELSESQMEKVI